MVLACISSSHVGTTLTAKRASSSDETTTVCLKIMLLLFLHQCGHQECKCYCYCCTNAGTKNVNVNVVVAPILASRSLLLHQFWHQNCYCCTNVGIKNISVGVCSGGVDLPLVNSSARYEHGHRRGDADGCRAGIPLFYSFTSFIISPIKMVSIGISPIKMVFHQ